MDTLFINKGFCTVYFGNKKKSAVTLPHSAYKKHAFLVKNNEMDKSKKVTPSNKVDFVIITPHIGTQVY